MSERITSNKSDWAAEINGSGALFICSFGFVSGGRMTLVKADRAFKSEKAARKAAAAWLARG